MVAEFDTEVLTGRAKKEIQLTTQFMAAIRLTVSSHLRFFQFMSESSFPRPSVLWQAFRGILSTHCGKP